MTKFVVVLHRRADFTPESFRRYFEEVHAPLARRLPDLVRYVRNFPVTDDARIPQWDAIVELYFSSRAAMERAWATPEGIAATSDLERFSDLARSSWAIVDVIDG